MFFILTIFLSIPSFVFSILAWRLKTREMFWLGVVFTALELAMYLFNLEMLIYIFGNIDSMIFGVFLLLMLGLPVYFLIASKITKSSRGSGSEISDDYLNSIINSDDEEIDYN